MHSTVVVTQGSVTQRNDMIGFPCISYVIDTSPYPFSTQGLRSKVLYLELYTSRCFLLFVEWPKRRDSTAQSGSQINSSKYEGPGILKGCIYNIPCTDHTPKTTTQPRPCFACCCSSVALVCVGKFSFLRSRLVSQTAQYTLYTVFACIIRVS